MAKSNAVKLQEALDRGDVEAAKVLAAKLAPAKPAKKVAGSSATQVIVDDPPPSKRRKPKPAPEPDPVPVGPTGRLIIDPSRPRDDVIDIADLRNGRYTVKPAGSASGIHVIEGPSERTRVNADGTTHRYTRRVSMASDPPKVVPLKDTGRGGYDPQFRGAMAKIDEANGQQAAEIDRRPPAQRVRCNCEGCRKEFVVFASDLTPRTDDDMRTDFYYLCPRCCRSGRGM